jgi:hypothetical protein
MAETASIDGNVLCLLHHDKHDTPQQFACRQDLRGKFRRLVQRSLKDGLNNSPAAVLFGLIV